MAIEGHRFVGSALQRMRPEAVLLSSFGLAIVVGTILLWLPFAHTGAVGFSEALFTAASAVCVTGLVVVDTGTDLTHFGQIVTAVLIQLGGLGVMTFAALAFELLGRRLPLSGQDAMAGALVHDGLIRGFRAHFRRMAGLIFTIEAIGAAALFVGLVPVRGVAHAAYSAIYHSISAFCNAGFSLYSDSLIGLRGNWIVVGTVALLIILGGIGYPVIFDVWGVSRSTDPERRPFWRRLNLHTRVTLLATLILIVAGIVLLAALGMESSGRHWGVDLAAAAFQSVTARTAGFNTVFINRLPTASLLVLMILMFIGGSPGSCAGGVKTTTFGIWVGQLLSRLKAKEDVVIQGRSISSPLVHRSSTIVCVAVLWNILGFLILAVTEANSPGAGFSDILFEQVSAFGTVGLSTGLTSNLSLAGRLWIVLTMFVGRTGPLTGVLLLLRRRPGGISYPEGKVMIG